MRDLYNDLYMGIPSGIRVEGCIVGRLWTTVLANGNLGVARTLDGGGDRDALAQSVIGAFLRDVGNPMSWDTPARAGVGAAALCAFYNTPARVAALSEPESEAPSGSVVISGDALAGRTLPGKLEQAGGPVVLEGIGVPAAPVLFSFDSPIRLLRGVVVAIPTTVESAARLDIPDLSPGVRPFTIAPQAPRYLHQRPETARYRASPYGASGFNSAFNPWEGKEYDRKTWPPIFKG